MKEKSTYRRFDLLSCLALLGCAGMLLFEAVFIFELYSRPALQRLNLFPAPAAPQGLPARQKAAGPDDARPAGNSPAPAVVPAG